MVYGLTKFKIFFIHTDSAARNSFHCVHIFKDIFKNNDDSQRVKLLSQRKVATLASGEPNETGRDCSEATLPKLSSSKLLYVTDKRNKCNYLINTGAAVSVLHRSCANGIADTDSLPLVAANNSTITTYGTCKRIVDVRLKREYSRTFIVADIKQPILGADSLIYYNILDDLQGICLSNMRTGLP